MNLTKPRDIKGFLYQNYHYIALLLFSLTNIYILFKTGIHLDDLWYKSIGVCSPSVMLEYFKWHYTHENGRLLMHILATVFLRNRITFVLWKVLLTFALILYCKVIAKLAVPDRENQKAALTLVVFLYMTVTFGVYARSVYWLTGSFNYFLPVLMLLLLMLWTVRKPNSVLLIIWSFLCGATMEQTGMMAFGWFVLIIFDAIVRKKKINTYTILCTVFSAIGYATVIFAPGTHNRVTNQGFQGARLLSRNILIIIRQNWIDNISVIIMVSFLAVCTSYWLYKFKDSSKFSRKITIPVIIYLISANILNCLLKAIIFALNFLGKTIPFSYVLNTLIGILWGLYLFVFAVSTVYVIVKLYIEKQAFLPFAATILAIGSQIMMAASNNSPERTCISGTTMFMFLIIYSVEYIYTDIKQRKHKISIKRPLIRTAVIIVCAFACVYQLAFFKIGGACGVPYDSVKYHSVDKNGLKELTDGREQSNIDFFSDPNSVWNVKYDLFNFLSDN